MEVKFFPNGITIAERFTEAFKYVVEYYEKNKIWENPQRDIIIFTKGAAHMRIVQAVVQEANITFPFVDFIFTSLENLDRASDGYKYHNSDMTGTVRIYYTTDVAESGITFNNAFCGIDIAIHHKPVYQNFVGK